MKYIVFSIGSFSAYGYGLMIAVGIIIALLIASYRAKKHGLDDSHLFQMALVGLASGLIGAKLLYIIVEFPSIIANPLKIFDFTSGLVVYGGLIGGIGAVYLYSRSKKIAFLSYMDIAIPEIAIAQGFGRIGCFLAGCCYGAETDAWYGVTFPEGGMAPSGVMLIPTQLISSVGDFLLAIFLFQIAKRKSIDGMVLGSYVILYSIGRFFVEFLRNDPRGEVGVLSTSQCISVFMLIIGISMIMYLRKRLNHK